MHPRSPQRPGPGGNWSARLLMLNRRQTRALVGGVIGFILIGLFPPWVHEYRNELGGRRKVSAGFSALAAPPATPATYNLYSTHPDYVLLLILWGAAAGLTAAGVLIMADKNSEATRVLSQGDHYERRPR